MVCFRPCEGPQCSSPCVRQYIQPPLFLSTEALLFFPRCFSLPCCSCCSPSVFTGFLWFVLTDLRPLSLCSRSQPDSTRCWSATRSSIWDWWKTWESGEPALLTDAVMRSFCRGDHLLFIQQLKSNKCSHTDDWNIFCIVNSALFAFVCLGTNPCARTHGLTGRANCLTEWPHWSNIWATSQRSTNWAGEHTEESLHFLLKHDVSSFWSFSLNPWTFPVNIFRSKIFIRFPKTLFATEDALETRKHDLGEIFCSHICWFLGKCSTSPSDCFSFLA